VAGWVAHLPSLLGLVAGKLDEPFLAPGDLALESGGVQPKVGPGEGLLGLGGDVR
jgi:hypothetical protein